MNNNHKISSKGNLLDETGALIEAGWSDEFILNYSPNMVAKSKKMRLKEWDYYHIINSEGKYAISFTFADNRYMGLVSCCVFDFETKEKFDCTETLVLPKGKMNLPRTSEHGNISFKSDSCSFNIDRNSEGRHIYCKYDTTFTHTQVEADFYLKQPPMDSIVMATPWKEDKKAFYYNQKITCMPADGCVKIKGRTYTFDSSKDFGILDWGRGVWTYDNTWYWGIGCSYVNGKPFGYNLGYGFGDTTSASENILFYDGKGHKLDRVDFGIPDNAFEEWSITSSDNRFNASFTPFFNDRTDISAGIISQHADKLFGFINGTAILDDGTEIKMENIPAFHEKVHNKW